MCETIKGWAIPANQFRRDLISLTGEGADINVKGVVSINGDIISFSSGVDYPYNTFVFRTKVYRLVSMTRTAPAFYEYVCNIDVLSSIYQNGGSIKVQTQRHHSPLRCVRREWGGEESISNNVVCDFTSKIVGDPGQPAHIIFICFVSTHNKILDREGDYVRYIMPVCVGEDATNEGWMHIRPEVKDSSDVFMGYYPNIVDCISDLDRITGLDGESITDVSYSMIPPFLFNATTLKFKAEPNNLDRDPNCSNVVSPLKTAFLWYQIDGVRDLSIIPNQEFERLKSVNYTHTVPKDTSFGYVAQDMSLLVEGRKCMDLLPKNGTVIVQVTPFYGYTGVGYVVSQGDNSTTVMGSKLPWVSSAWLTYSIQKKTTDESKMWYDTIKSVLSLGIGVGGAGLTGGATAMTVPSSAVSIGDAYMNQKFNEEYIQKVPYGAGCPYGDIGSLFYLVRTLKYPIYVVITKYSGQPELPIETGKIIGYPAAGRDDIVPGGYFMGEIYSISAHWCLSQNEMDILINSLRRGVKT